MHTTKSALDLIGQCEFPSENPFELRENIFPVLNSIATPTMTKIFEKACYGSWLIFGFNGESQVSIFYDSILQKLQDGSLDNYYGHLMLEDRQQIENNFKSIIQDEIKHREIFKSIIEKMDSDKTDYRPEYYNPECKEYADSEWKLWDSYVLMDFLCPIVTGESYLLAAFVLFYKYTENLSKREIFKEFIQDESKHVAHFMNFMKKAKVPSNQRSRFHNLFLVETKRKMHFEKNKFEDFLNSIVKDLSKKQEITEVAYNTEFHRTFRKIFLKKSWQFYNIVFPNIDQDTFEQYLN